MKFRIICLNCLKIEKEEELEYFEKLGFEFEPYEGHFISRTEIYDNGIVFIEINNLEEIEALSKKADCELIVNFKEKSITIYNGYNE